MKKWFVVGIIIFSSCTTFLPMLFIRLSENMESLMIYIFGMIIFTCISIALTVYVWKKKEILPENNNIKLPTYNYVHMSMMPWLLVIVILYEIFINIAYGEFLESSLSFPLSLFQWPILRFLFVAYEIVHGYFSIQLLDVRKYKISLSNKVQVSLSILFSIDFIIWIIGVINLSSGSTESWASKAFPNWEISRKIFWSFILLYRLLLVNVIFKFIWFPHNSKNNHEHAHLINHEHSGEATNVFSKFVNWILTLFDYKVLSFGIFVVGLAIIISSYNSSEKYINEYVRIGFFIGVEGLCMMLSLVLIVKYIIFKGNFKKRILKKWIHYIPTTIFFVSSILFTVFYCILIRDEGTQKEFIMIIFDAIAFSICSILIYILQLTNTKAFTINKKNRKIFMNVLVVLFGMLIITVIRLIAFEGLNEEVIKKYKGLMITIPLTIDYVLHSALTFYYKIHKMNRYKDPEQDNVNNENVNNENVVNGDINNVEIVVQIVE